jgi:hypothetical protein
MKTVKSTPLTLPLVLFSQSPDDSPGKIVLEGKPVHFGLVTTFRQ